MSSGTPQSDNAIEAGDKIHGGPKTTDQVEIHHKTAPMPDLSEVHDRNLSGGAAPGHTDGHGHDEGVPRKQREDTSRGGNKGFDTVGEHPLDQPMEPSIRTQ